MHFRFHILLFALLAGSAGGQTELVPLIADPFTSVEDVLIRLDPLEQELHEVGIDPWRFVRQWDFLLVNVSLSVATDPVEEGVAIFYDPPLAELDAALGQLDEILANQILVEWRRIAWEWTVALVDAKDPQEFAEVAWWIEFRAWVWATQIAQLR